jgi:hypothetical protein
VGNPSNYRFGNFSLALRGDSQVRVVERREDGVVIITILIARSDDVTPADIVYIERQVEKAARNRVTLNRRRDLDTSESWGPAEPKPGFAVRRFGAPNMTDEALRAIQKIVEEVDCQADQGPADPEVLRIHIRPHRRASYADTITQMVQDTAAACGVTITPLGPVV